MTQEQIWDIFSYHPPSAEEREAYDKINAAFIACAEAIEPLLPEGPGKTVAIRKLSEARMQANHTISLKGRF